MYKLALIEDSPDYAYLLQENLNELKEESFELRQAATLAEAHELLAAWTPDVILLDLGLPDCRGVESLVRLTRAYPRCPVVVLTGDSRPETAEEVLAAGARGLLLKGKDQPPALLQAIREAAL